MVSSMGSLTQMAAMMVGVMVSEMVIWREKVTQMVLVTSMVYSTAEIDLVAEMLWDKLMALWWVMLYRLQYL